MRQDNKLKGSLGRKLRDLGRPLVAAAHAISLRGALSDSRFRITNE
jgi:hypothetical protein